MIFRELLNRNPVLPAPMCNISDRATREMQRRFGAGMVYTQMVSMEGLIRNDAKTYDLLDIDGEEPPVAVQIFGSNPDSAAEAARILEQRGAALVDLNMGCPARKVTGNHCGAALLNDPPLVARIVRAVVDAIRIPFTVKTRWDWDDSAGRAIEVARICEAEGAQAIALHARTRAEKYSGTADWSRIAELKNAVSIPVIGNGDIRSGDDAMRMMRVTGCDGVMIGRGLIGAPWLLADCAAAMRGRTAAEITFDSRLDIMLAHAEAMVRAKGESRGLREFRKHAVAYLKGLRNSHALKNELMKVDTSDGLRDRIEEFRDTNREFHTTPAPTGA